MMRVRCVSAVLAAIPSVKPISLFDFPSVRSLQDLTFSRGKATRPTAGSGWRALRAAYNLCTRLVKNSWSSSSGATASTSFRPASAFIT